MMTGKNDDAAHAREDSFLGELIPQVTEHLAAQHSGEFDAEAERARFVTWLAAHAKEPAALAKGRASGGTRVTNDNADRRPPLDRNLLALLEVEKERCQDRDVAFVTPNLLVALLGAHTGAARRIADRACPGAFETLVACLRRYEPLDGGGAVQPFEDFDWYDLADVQAARRRAQQEAAKAIDVRHLLLGFLDTDGATRSALRRALGDEGFERLVRTAETSDRADGTPGIGDFLVVPQASAGEQKRAVTEPGKLGCW